MEKLLPILLKVFVFCEFVTGAVGFYQQMMFNAAWRRDQYDQGRSEWSAPPNLFSRNLSAECRLRRQKVATAALAFFVFLGLGMVTLKAGYQLGIFPDKPSAQSHMP
jgi:hypothetical protein